MKKLIKNIIIAALIISLAALSLGSAGSSSDPLISRSWLEGDFRTMLMRELDTHITAGFNNIYNSKFSGRPLVPEETGYSHLSGFGAVNLYPGQTLLLSQGTSFSVKSDGITASVSSGVVIDLSTAAEAAGQFNPASGRSYLLPESSAGTLTATGDGMVTILIDGYYKLSGEARTHHAVFKDVPLDAWYYKPVDYAYTHGLFSGTSATEFSPSVAMTRGMFVTVLYRLYGAQSFDTIGISGFPDVADPSMYYYAPVMWAAANGIVLGSDDGKFNPNSSVTREQMATIMYRYAAWLQEDTATAPQGDAALLDVLQSFPDVGNVSSYALAAMRWAVSNKIINGSDGKLLPLDTAQRSHVAQIIMNFATR